MSKTIKELEDRLVEQIRHLEIGRMTRVNQYFRSGARYHRRRTFDQFDWKHLILVRCNEQCWSDEAVFQR